MTNSPQRPGNLQRGAWMATKPGNKNIPYAGGKTNRIVRAAAFWSFQIINTLAALLMVFAPGPFHESLFSDPQAVYAKLGFSDIAVAMGHNLIRGHGAALLAVSIFIWIEGFRSRSVHLLMTLVCALSVYAHGMTLIQHLESEAIIHAIGNFGSLYGTIAVTAAVGILNGIVYFSWPDPSRP